MSLDAYFVCLCSFDFCQVDTTATDVKDRDPVENLGQVGGREGVGEERSGLICCVRPAGCVWRANKSVTLLGKWTQLWVVSERGLMNSFFL